MPLTLRDATPEDCLLLHSWRNDPETCAASHNADEVDLDTHTRWFQSTLDNPNRTLLIAEYDGAPVGTVRIDFEEDGCALSWTVAPTHRGRGLGTQMVRQVLDGLTIPARAEVKRENIASQQIAQRAGMVVQQELEGVLHYVFTPKVK